MRKDHLIRRGGAAVRHPVESDVVIAFRRGHGGADEPLLLDLLLGDEAALLHREQIVARGEKKQNADRSGSCRPVHDRLPSFRAPGPHQKLTSTDMVKRRSIGGV